ADHAQEDVHGLSYGFIYFVTCSRYCGHTGVGITTFSPALAVVRSVSKSASVAPAVATTRFESTARS
ncbi:MAG: hypothetical protein RI568_10700, partial [Natronomonas sp.]